MREEKKEERTGQGRGRFESIRTQLTLCHPLYTLSSLVLLIILCSSYYYFIDKDTKFCITKFTLLKIT